MTYHELRLNRALAYKAGDVLLNDANKVLHSGMCTLSGWYDLRVKGYDLILSELAKCNAEYDATNKESN